jgi:hypothetical protein
MRSIVLVLLCAFLLAGCTELFGPAPSGPCDGTPIKLAFSPDGKSLAAVYSSALCIYGANGSILRTLSIANYSFSDFVWMPDGRIVTAASPACPLVMETQDGWLANVQAPGCNAVYYLLTFWSANSNQPLHTVIVPGSFPNGMSLSTAPQGQVAVSYSSFNDTTSSYLAGVDVIDSKTYTSIKNIPVDYFVPASFSPDGKYLETVVGDPATCDSAPEYDFYSIPAYSSIYNLSDPEVEELAWSSNGTTMAGLIWGQTTNLTLFSVQESNGSFQLVPDGNYILGTINGYQMGGDSIKFSPDGRYVAIGGPYSVSACPSVPGMCSMGGLEVFDMQSKSVVFEDSGGTNRDNTAVFVWSPDGKLAYLFSSEGISDLKIVGPANFTAGQ